MTTAQAVVLTAGEKFTPSASTDVPGVLTSDAAWRALTRQLGTQQDAPPASVTGTLGTLTFQQLVDAPVYAFTNDSGCLYTGPIPVTGHSFPSRPTRCVEWTFVNATTGAMIESTWEPAPP